ncbi:MAG: hypothetical protein ABS85_16045 [Sphingobacteriales bacterium SCN 48-20]|uniref:L,D-transpeptidase family protein n=1 Tax=Terrimonas ferruginea TaxID=249 RepID=UPI000869422A|nr:L,D-transpeptidase family protein [Terrimonas ferruginea]MBN8784895.1 L,D-transpeptidase family protein [Terrimonas ferruginea]ODT90177.1 MAG: hypothetical protein ABS85_16045 [Sphingobacteriales bacterium SCN 48-20]OJW43706.1 MAG: hypothetical protein BGO56_05230 [Sphingobacteriales bacterium 48-107]
MWTQSLLLYLLLLSGVVRGQSTGELLRSRLQQRDIPSLVYRFYRLTDMQVCWLGKNQEALKLSADSLFKNAGSLGVDVRQPEWPSFDKLPVTASDSIETEIGYTKSLFALMSALTCGQREPVLSFKGVTAACTQDSLPNVLLTYYRSAQLQLMADSLATLYKPVIPLLRQLKILTASIESPGYSEQVMNAVQVDPLNKVLVAKLRSWQLVHNDSTPSKQDMKKAVKVLQHTFGLITDGVIRSSLKQEINVPLTRRITQLKSTIDANRWLYGRFAPDSVVVVNIPAATLTVSTAREEIIRMRIVVGNPSMPTPTLSSYIREVILYPYWTVPHSIAVNELLPKIKRDKSMLENFQLLDQQGRIVNPQTVNWNKLSATNFPYTLRQSTGCDNALGILKLNFDNPFSVYLHDTPAKGGFLLERRFLSHGCMRMEEPFALARLLLPGNEQAVDTLSTETCSIVPDKPLVLKAIKPLRLVVWYQLAGTDAEGNVIFCPDVYKTQNN